MGKEDLRILNPFPTANIMSADLFIGLSGVRPKEFLYPQSLSDSNVQLSLKRFTDRITKSGELTSLIRSFLKGKEGIPNMFTLLTHSSRDRSAESPSDFFYLDGEHSFMLFYGDPHNGVGVCGAFSLIEKDEMHSRYYPLNVSDKPKRLLLINQLQGSRNGDDQVREVFSHFRWEKVLVVLIYNWARSVGFHEVFILPSTNNLWAVVRLNINGSAHLRYDVTARRLKFNRTGDEEPYRLILDEDLIELYKSLFEPDY